MASDFSASNRPNHIGTVASTLCSSTRLPLSSSANAYDFFSADQYVSLSSACSLADSSARALPSASFPVHLASSERERSASTANPLWYSSDLIGSNGPPSTQPCPTPKFFGKPPS